MNISTQTKLGLGSALASLGALGMILSLLLRWAEAPQPWGSLLGFLVGILVGIGVTLVLVGLIERRGGK